MLEFQLNFPSKDSLNASQGPQEKTPADLVAQAEEMGIEGASTMRKQDLMFSILKVRAEMAPRSWARARSRC